MGQPQAKPLHQEEIISNLSSHTLVDIIGQYFNGEDSFYMIREILSSNWSYRGNSATKEHLEVACTAGTQGQGKTELCKQLCLMNSTWNLIGVRKMVTIPISFNQDCTFAKSELDTAVDFCIVWRILRAFGISDDDFSMYPAKLEDLISFIRKCNCAEGEDPKSVGVFLLFDEMLKVKTCDTKFFERVLDVITTLQQRHLRNMFPTFVFITSLQLLPVSKYLVEGSGRRVRCVSLPIFCQIDLEVVASKLYSFFFTVLCIGKTTEQIEQLIRFKNLENLIRIVVSVSGRHFRTLELAMGVVYGHLITEEQHKLALTTGVQEVGLFRPDLGIKVLAVEGAHQTKVVKKRSSGHSQLSVFDRKGAGVDMAVRDVFKTIVNNMDLSGVDARMYEEVIDLFFQLIVDSNHHVSELDVYHLEAVNLVYVKYRDPERRMYIVPRVSLPCLYFFVNTSRASRIPKALNLQVDKLLQMIGTELSRPFDELPAAFEMVMPLAELITVAAHLIRVPSQIIAMQDLLPGVIFRPWKNESLRVASFVTSSAITPFMPTNNGHTAHYPGQSDGKRAVRGAVGLSLTPDCNAVYIHQAAPVNMEEIEHVSRLFSLADGQQAVPCFCSMKIRKKTKPGKLAECMHTFIKKEIQPSTEYTLPESSYYIVIYCCTKGIDVNAVDLPPGTMVVPYETVQRILYPFGLNQMVIMAEEKANDKRK